MNLFKGTLTVLLLLLACLTINAQIGENSWLNGVITVNQNKWAVSLRVTERLNVDNKQIEINRHINTFTDLAISRSLPKNLTVKLLTRRFFNPKPKRGVSFLWTDLIHKFTYKTITLKNLLRFHGALDLYDQNNADFIRYIPNLSYKYSKRSSIFVQSDLFFQLNSINQPKRIRYQAGISHKLNKTTSINVQYWRETSINIEPKISTNIYVFTLAHNLKL